MWVVSFCLLLIVLVWQAYQHGPYRALGCTVALSLLVPTWVVLEVAGLPLDIRVATAIASLGVYVVHRDAVIRTPLVLVDYLGISLLAVHLASDWTNEGFQWRTPLQAYGEWAVPYMAGRQALRTWKDVRWLTPVMLGICVVLSLAAAVETIFGLNLFEVVFGRGEVDGIVRHTFRWGWKRAMGPLRNPIYFGTLQLLLIPWALYAVSLARTGQGPAWWRVMPAISAFGILCSLSRGPIAGMIVLLYVAAVMAYPRWRRVLVVGGIAAAILMAANYGLVLRTLGRLANEAPSSRLTRITVDDKQVEYSNTYHRLYLFDVYGTAMKRAGLLGFGTDRTSIFPPQVPIGPEHAETLKRLWCVDNAYILLTLRFGYLGLLAFVAMSVAAAITYIQISHMEAGSKAAYTAVMGAAVCGFLAVLMTVWMPQDFGFLFMWVVGGSAGLYAMLRFEPELDS